MTTVFMSSGYHYYETLQTSLSLQWLDKARAPEMLGRMIAAGAFASVLTFGLIWVAFNQAALDFHWVYLMGGGATVVIALIAWGGFPHFPEVVRQHHLRKCWGE